MGELNYCTVWKLMILLYGSISTSNDMHTLLLVMNSNTPSLAMTTKRSCFVTFSTSCSGSANTPTVSASESPKLLQSKSGRNTKIEFSFGLCYTFCTDGTCYSTADIGVELFQILPTDGAPQVRSYPTSLHLMCIACYCLQVHLTVYRACLICNIS